MTVAPSPFAQAAPTLIGLGFHPVPILPPTAPHGGKGKAPGDFVMGGWRGMSKWQNLRDTPPTDWQMNLWTRYAGANIGVVMGSPSGPDLHVLAVDVDTLDPDELRDILGALPHSPMSKRGAKGETRFYRAAKTIRTASYDKTGGIKPVRLVDLLTGFDTRQTVCPPSVHPDGQVYVWLQGPCAASDLPEFTADHLSELEETLEACGWVRGGGGRVKVDRIRGLESGRTWLPDEDDFFTETKSAALANMDAWVHDLDVYGLRPARGGYEAVATWRPSSTGRPICDRKLNLSIQAEGIKDFGTNWTGSAIDLVMAAQNLPQAEATSWLRMRLGLTGETIVLQQPSRSGTIEATGTVQTPNLPDRDIEPVTVRKSVEMARVDDTELPDRLTHVPGLVGLITDWISDSARRPQRGLALGAALTLVGTAAGRKVAGPTRSGTHLYVLGIARTSAGKDHALQAVSRILAGSAMNAHIGPSQFMSMSALINRLTRQPLTLSPIDEFGSFLARVNGKRSSTHERAITGVMRSAWGASFQTLNPPEWAGRSSTPIYSPAFSLYGVSTPEEFYSAIEGADVFNGFLNRFLTISTRERPTEREPICDAHEVPDAIGRGMIGVYNVGGVLLGASSHGSQADAPALVVPWDHPQAHRVYQRFGEEIEKREAEMAFLARSVEMSLRLATIRAIGISTLNPRITVEDMEWGRDVARWSAERMMEDAADFMADNDRQGEAMKIMRLIKSKGRVAHRDVVRAMAHKISTRDLKDLLASLTESGQITVESVRPESGGHPANFYSVG